jgi:hypothetical protein
VVAAFGVGDAVGIAVVVRYHATEERGSETIIRKCRQNIVVCHADRTTCGPKHYYSRNDVVMVIVAVVDDIAVVVMAIVVVVTAGIARHYNDYYM